MSDTENGEDSHGSLVINNKKLLMWLFLGSDCMFFWYAHLDALNLPQTLP